MDNSIYSRPSTSDGCILWQMLDPVGCIIYAGAESFNINNDAMPSEMMQEALEAASRCRHYRFIMNADDTNLAYLYCRHLLNVLGDKMPISLFVNNELIYIESKNYSYLQKLIGKRYKRFKI